MFALNISEVISLEIPSTVVNAPGISSNLFP
jgi:hypothetical protein